MMYVVLWFFKWGCEEILYLMWFALFLFCLIVIFYVWVGLISDFTLWIVPRNLWGLPILRYLRFIILFLRHLYLNIINNIKINNKKNVLFYEKLLKSTTSTFLDSCIAAFCVFIECKRILFGIDSFSKILIFDIREIKFINQIGKIQK